MLSVQDRLEQARYAVGRGIPRRRACTLLSVARSGLGYQCKMPVKDRPIVAAMRQYSEHILVTALGGFESFKGGMVLL